MRRDLRSLPRNLIDTNTSENLRCAPVKVQPPLLLSSTFLGDRENCLFKLRHLFKSPFNLHFFTSQRREKVDFKISRYILLRAGNCSMTTPAMYTYDFYIQLQIEELCINRTSIIRIFYYLNVLRCSNVLTKYFLIILLIVYFLKIMMYFFTSMALIKELDKQRII